MKAVEIICNFANPDMVGHTGNFSATVKAIETIDSCLAQLIPAIQKQSGEALITADHGNAECMFDDATGQAAYRLPTFASNGGCLDDGGWVTGAGRSPV